MTKIGTDSTLAKLCILDTVAIPKRPVFVSGFIRVVGVNGIQVVPSQEKEQINKGETFHGLSADTISIIFPDVDSVLIEKTIDRIRTLQTTQN